LVLASEAKTNLHPLPFTQSKLRHQVTGNGSVCNQFYR
jgi:hypothetical protein